MTLQERITEILLAELMPHGRFDCIEDHADHIATLIAAAAEEHYRPRIDAEVDALLAERADGSLFAPHSMQHVRERLAHIDRTPCMCSDSSHENALHDLARDDVPELLHVIEALAPRRIETTEQLDALAVESVVKVGDGPGGIYEKDRDGGWASDDWINYDHLPAVVLWSPGAGE